MVVIAISGKPGCGSSTTGKMLAEKLGLKFFSTGEYYKKMAREKAAQKYHSETATSVNYFSSKEGSAKELHEAIDNMQIEKAKEGNIVSEGKLAIHFLENIADYKVWLEASAGVRMQRYAKRDGISLKEAEKLVKEKDSLERATFKRIYGFDTFSQEKGADITIDTSSKKPEEIVAEIAGFVNSNVMAALGYKIKFPEERYTHIVIRHPEMESKRNHIKDSLTNPAIIKKSHYDEKVLIYYKESGKEYIATLVKILNKHGFILTSYITEVIKKGDTVWTKN